jgi:hypothetical protein
VVSFVFVYFLFIFFHILRGHFERASLILSFILFMVTAVQVLWFLVFEFLRVSSLQEWWVKFQPGKLILGRTTL